MSSGLLSKEPTAAHRACISELVLRFPCPRDTDPDDYAARAELLARDCASLQAGLLRKACDRVAQSARGMPYASEIHAAAAAIVEERQRAQAAPERTAGDNAPGGISGLNIALIERNRHIIATNFRFSDGKEHRWVNDNGVPKLVRVSGDRPDARCNGDGTVSFRRWDEARRQWVFGNPA